MRLHDGVRNEGSGDLISTEPTTIEALDSVLSGFNGIKLNVYLSLKGI